MRSKGNTPTADQKRWREIVREQGSVISGEPAVIHHAIGATGSHNKVKIGHWWLIPLTDDEHKALHNGDTFGFDSRKEFEKAMFAQVCMESCDHHPWEWQPPEEVYNAIQAYHL